MSEQTEQPGRCQWSFKDPLIGQELDCYKEPQPGFDYCLFHKPEKTPQEVEQFTQAIRAQVEEDQHFNFAGYRFPADWDYFQERTLTGADFRGAEFEGDVSFEQTHFEPVAEGGISAAFLDARFGGDAHFRYARFGGDAYFEDARFGGRAHFWDARFAGDAWLWGARFGGDADFVGARFGGRADFEDAQFGGDAEFRGARFDGIALFVGARFDGDARFWNARFGGSADFGGALFGEDADFWGAGFGGDADFQRAHFARKAGFAGTVFSGLANWEGAHFHAQADFTDVAQPASSRFLIALPRADTKSADRETHFAQPPTGAQLCRLAKETARRSGDYRLAGDYFYFERMYADLARLPWPSFAWRRVMHKLGRRKLPRIPEGLEGKPLMTQEQLEKAWLRPSAAPKVPWRDRMRAVVGLSFWALCGYCERPVWVLGWSVAVVVFWAMLYWRLGLVRLSGATYPIHGLLQNLYFSVVTFTTLGFGDFEPVKSGLGMFLAASEAFIGMFMIALFVVSVAKRFSRG